MKTDRNNIQIETDNVEVVGYPGDKVEGEKKTMWTVKGKCSKKD